MRLLLYTLLVACCVAAGPVEPDSLSTGLDIIHRELDPIVSAWKGHELFAVWLCNHLTKTLGYVEVMDLGVDYGFSTFSFGLALHDGKGHVTGIDSFEGDPNAGIRATYDGVQAKLAALNERYDIDVNIVKGDFIDESKKWDVDLHIIHLDGFHSYTAVKPDYDAWLPHLVVDGVFLMHDTVSFPDVRRVFNDSPLHKVNFGHAYGLGVLSRDKAVIDLIAKTFNLPILTR